MAPSTTKPPYDPELALILQAMPESPPLTKETLIPMRTVMAALYTPERVFTDPDITHSTQTIPGPIGDIEISTIGKKGSDGKKRGAIYYMHGGGMIVQGLYVGVSMFFDWIKEMDLQLFTVEYRVAPENPHPAPVNDCWAGLKWVFENAGELGVDTGSVMVVGLSAGGGLAAAMTLMARDRGLPGGGKLMASCLICPMLDDRNITTSSQQFLTEGLWKGESNKTAWGWVLSGKRGADDVDPYAAPARAKSLEGLPSTWINVGGAEVFRDECIEYARRLWEAGNDAELHVWRGGWHAFDAAAPDTQLSKVLLATRFDWARRIFKGSKGAEVS